MTACGQQPTRIDVSVADQVERPQIDCRPYPQPTPIAVADVTPRFLSDGVVLSHADYLTVAQLNLDLETYMQQTRAIGVYFVRCLHNFNTKVRALNAHQSKEIPP